MTDEPIVQEQQIEVKEEEPAKPLSALDIFCQTQQQLFSGCRFQITFEFNEEGKFTLISANRVCQPVDDLPADHITPRG